MKKHRAFRCACGLVLALALAFTSLPVSTYAAKSSAQIQSEIDSLKQENKGIQAQIDAIQKQYDANASEIGELVAKKDAIDQEIALINAQIDNLNAQITAFGQMIADAQDEMDLGQLVLPLVRNQLCRRVFRYDLPDCQIGIKTFQRGNAPRYRGHGLPLPFQPVYVF